jgi:hypothetical protein
MYASWSMVLPSPRLWADACYATPCSVGAPGSSLELGGIIWTTMLQQLVPQLGRVSSLDWLVSAGLVPVSFALTGPVAGAIGAEWTMVAAGTIGAVLMGALLFAPGVRDPERLPRAQAAA